MIGRYLNAKDLIACSNVCTAWYHMAGLKEFWKEFLHPKDDEMDDPKLLYILKQINKL